MLSGNRVGPVLPVQLKGVVSLQFNASFSKLPYERFGGECQGIQICGERRRVRDRCAARRCLKRPTRREVRVQKASGTSREIICRLKEKGRISSWTGRLDIPTDVERTLSFGLREGRFLLVQMEARYVELRQPIRALLDRWRTAADRVNLHGCDDQTEPAVGILFTKQDLIACWAKAQPARARCFD